MPPSLDHLILFLPASSTQTPTIPSSLSKAFTLIPGGTHADNITANTLIPLADGSYIELICFLPQPTPSAIQNHWWGPSPTRTGWTDWCLTTDRSPDENYAAIATTHDEPITGGRKRVDGEMVRWSVTFPRGENGGQGSRGRVPFFCHDLTERALRVPEGVEHASGVLGVKEITVVVGRRSVLEELRGVYEGIFGVEAVTSGGDGEIVFEIGRVKEVSGLETGPRVVLRLARDEGEEKKVEARGFWFGHVVLSARSTNGKESGRLERIDTDGDIGGIWIQHI